MLFPAIARPRRRRGSLPPSILALLFFFTVLSVARTGPAEGQTVNDAATARNELTLSVEPLAAGGRYLRRLGSDWRAGLALSVGPHAGVTLSEEKADDVREWLNAHFAVGYSASRMRALLMAGAAWVIGNDFDAFYPHGRAGLELAVRRFRLGTDVRVLRIASGFGRGVYRVQWVPLRAGWVINW